MEYEIVSMDRSHLKQIAALEQQCFSQPWSEWALEEALYNPQVSFLVAEDGRGGVLGYAGVQVILDEGYIANIAVAPGARRHGVASAMLEVFCRFAQEHLAFLTLEVRASNRAAIALYQKYGFSTVGQRNHFYEDPQEDALIMTREFCSASRTDGHL